MIGIRSITYHMPKNINSEHLKIIRKASFEWLKKYPLIRTQRMALFPILEPINVSELDNIAKFCNQTNIRWFNLPFDILNSPNKNGLIHCAYNILSYLKNAFVNIIGVSNNYLDESVISQYASLSRKVSTISSNGNDNFRLGFSINIESNGAFFPFTYSSGNFGFSIALELTQEINMICLLNRVNNINELRKMIIESIKPQIDNLNEIAENIAKKTGLIFHGFDFSLAPIIDEYGSIITLLNSFGIFNFGKVGSMFVTGYITNILKHFAKCYKSVGFSGVMYSLLEDLDLCMINNERGVTLSQLISLSTMCGCGVDMVPVYGKITDQEIRSIVLEVAGISCKLNKPLGVRILPIPSAKRGAVYYTEFYDDADFISNTKVVDIDLNLITSLGDTINYLEL